MTATSAWKRTTRGGARPCGCRRYVLAGIASLAALGGGPLPAPAQEQGPADEKKQADEKKPRDLNLAKAKQEEARQMLERIEESMDRLARLLAANEPQNAAKLRLAFRQARERLLREDMERISKYLAERKLDRALSGQKDVKVSLEEILAILLEKDIDPRELLKHVRRLRDLVSKLDGIINAETREKLASDDSSLAEASSDALTGELAKLEELIRREKALEGRTAGEAAASKDKLAGLAPEQDAVRDETRGLRARDEERVKKKAAEAASQPRPTEGGEPGEGATPAEGAARPGAEGGEPAPGEPAPGEPAPGERDPGEPKRTPPPSEAPPPAPGGVLDGGALERAESAMAAASEAMRAGEGAGAGAKTSAARRALEEATGAARDALERLRARRNYKEMKEEQEATRKETDDLAASMREPPPLINSPEEGVPGRSDVESASGDMSDAAGSLGAGRPRRASPSQGRALDKLKQGREKAEETLAELQRALRERLLAYLKEKFTKMLEEQRLVTRSTRSLDLKLKALRAAAAAEGAEPEVDRKDRQLAGDLAGREEALAAVAADVIDLLSEDGTTLVFPEVVGQLQDDLRGVSALLARLETGERTQYVQRQIEESIQEILAALEVARRSPPPPNPNQGRNSRSGAGPLLPASSELKMVRSLQLRVNDRTQAFDLARPAAELGPEEKLQVDGIAKKQKQVEDMLRKLARELGER